MGTDDVAPVLFAEGRATAHLMVYVGADLRPYEPARSPAASGAWRSLCGYGMRRSYERLGEATRGAGPRKPWCSGCSRIAHRTVAGYAAAGMLGDLHAFTEHIADGSVCVCGRPASDHRVGRYAG